MRKLLALILIAMLALGMSFAIIGCGAPQSQESQSMENTAPSETSTPAPGDEAPMESDSTGSMGSEAPAEGGH